MEPINLSNGVGSIRLHDVVHKGLTDRLIDEARAFKDRELNIEINSPGGSVRSGWQLHRELTALRGRGVKVTATVTGKAARMGSVIAMAADKVRMSSDAYLMIHDASVFTGGTSRDLRAAADLLDTLGSEIADVYAARTKQPKERIVRMMSAETFMDAATAKKLGFVDEVFEAPAQGVPQKLLDRIAALERVASAAKQKPTPVALRKVESTARKTAATLSTARRDDATTKPVGRTAAELLALRHIEQAGLAARASCFGGATGDAARAELHGAWKSANPRERELLETGAFAPAFHSNVFNREL